MFLNNFHWSVESNPKLCLSKETRKQIAYVDFTALFVLQSILNNVTMVLPREKSDGNWKTQLKYQLLELYQIPFSLRNRLQSLLSWSPDYLSVIPAIVFRKFSLNQETEIINSFRAPLDWEREESRKLFSTSRYLFPSRHIDHVNSVRFHSQRLDRVWLHTSLTEVVLRAAND